MDFNQAISLYTLIISFMAFVMLAIYTCITNRLFITSQQQLMEIIEQGRLSITPALDVSLKDVHSRYILSIKNLGNGVALNVRVNNITFKGDGLDKVFYQFEAIPMLRILDSYDVISNYFVGGVEKPDMNNLIELTLDSTEDHILNLSFQDLAGKNYLEKYQIGKSGIKFISLHPTQSERNAP